MRAKIVAEKVYILVTVGILAALSPFVLTFRAYAKPVAVPLSLQEAYQVGAAAASQWNLSSRLYEMTSTDQGEDPTVPEIERGLNGRRISWNLDFVIPKTERHLRLEIRGGQVAFKTEVVGPIADSFFEPDEVMAIHVVDQLNTAKRGGLLPGKGWATGYHFRLLKDESAPVLVIRGLDSGTNAAIAAFNTRTEKLILREHKLPNGEWQQY